MLYISWTGQLDMASIRGRDQASVDPRREREIRNVHLVRGVEGSKRTEIVPTAEGLLRPAAFVCARVRGKTRDQSPEGE